MDGRIVDAQRFRELLERNIEVLSHLVRGNTTAFAIVKLLKGYSQRGTYRSPVYLQESKHALLELRAVDRFDNKIVRTELKCPWNFPDLGPGGKHHDWEGRVCLSDSLDLVSRLTRSGAGPACASEHSTRAP